MRNIGSTPLISAVDLGYQPLCVFGSDPVKQRIQLGFYPIVPFLGLR